MMHGNDNTEGLRILYDSKEVKYKKPFGCLRQGEECRIRIGVPVTCPVVNVNLIIEREDGYKKTVPLMLAGQEGNYLYFEGTFSLNESGLYFYVFCFEKADSSFTLYRCGDSDTNMEDGEKWQITCVSDDYFTPSSFEGKVVYQIFPDRFAKEGETDISEKLGPFTVHTDISEPPLKGADEHGNWNSDFYGGNLKGIQSKLPYLKELGVGVIYLNPIFKAFSNHRYDTADFMKIDPMLGTDEDFSELCKEAEKQGIRIILDGVFSHVGSNSIYFDKDNVFGGGAVSDPDSPYRSWFDFKTYPDEYTCWWDIPTLPCINEMSDGYLDLIIRNEDSVIAHYLRLGASGFRLDVADELPDEFIAMLRERVKEINPDAIVIGEVWEDASNKISYNVRRKYFSGSELDSVMNYVYRDAVINLLKKDITPAEFIGTVNTIYENYPKSSLNCCMTLLSSHDTRRVRTMLENNVSDTVKALKTASAIQYFLPGMPMIYYGDEVGMKGSDDPENREFFKCGENSDELLDHYRMLGRLRNEKDALRVGDLEITECEGNLKITRKTQNESISLNVCVDELTFEIQ